MKTNRVIIAALAAAMAVSCQDEFQVESGNRTFEPMTISTEAQTKTSLSGTEVHWTGDDVIAVFDNTGAKNEFTISNADGSSADFSGNVTEGTTQIYAVYPYNLAESISAGTIKVTVPADQTSKSGSFAEEHNISVAKAPKTPGVPEVSGVTFKNACAFLKFTVPAYLDDVQKVTVSSNTAMAGEMNIDYSGDTPACTLSENGSKSISMTGTYEAGSTFWFVLAPVTLDGITVNVETAKGTYSMSTSNQFEMAAGQYKNLGTLNLDKASMTGASAAHTYSNGTLTGSEVTISLGIPETTAAYITALTLEVKNAEGAIVRTLSKNSAAATETIAADPQWPYLPKGDYTISGSYTLSGMETKELSEVPFTVAAPEFTIVSGAYSSYTKYLDGKSSEANSCQAETIYALNTVAISISDNILNNANYSAIRSQATFTLDGNSTTAGSASGQAWGNHTVTAAFTFDGVTKTSSKDCYITGLPYSINTAANDSTHAWEEEGNVKWNTDGGVRLGNNQWGGDAYIGKTFNTPSDTKITVFAEGIVNGTGSIIKVENTVSINVSGKDIFSQSQKGKSETTFKCDNMETSLSSSNGLIKINSSYNIANAKVVVKKFTIKYGTK